MLGYTLDRTQYIGNRIFKEGCLIVVDSQIAHQDLDLILIANLNNNELAIMHAKDVNTSEFAILGVLVCYHQ